MNVKVASSAILIGMTLTHIRNATKPGVVSSPVVDDAPAPAVTIANFASERTKEKSFRARSLH